MKSINILSFLLLSTTLSLVAFSQSSISDNNGNVESPPVLFMDGEPLKINEEYSILSVLPGGGSTYLADLGNTKCPNGVVQDSSGCVNETIWKAGDYMLGATHPLPRFVITGGTLGPNTLKNWFKIEKYETGRVETSFLQVKGYARLALNNKPYPFGFTKVNKNDA
ncbi:hypothetical protein KY284_016996 [Solanum tuberosum]|nr:hypothetical protein KY284_016996 [Solanum tuberosum]